MGVKGCLGLKIEIHRDARGSFVKPFNRSWFQDLGLVFEPREVYLSTSHKGVLRGMHYQSPPHHHSKLVVCLSGAVCDVVLDLRGREALGKFASIRLDAADINAVFVPPGIAHGFLSLVDGSQLLYIVDSEYAPEFDNGVRWDSFGFSWPEEIRTVSQRDSNFLTLNAFETPFSEDGD